MAVIVHPLLTLLAIANLGTTPNPTVPLRNPGRLVRIQSYLRSRLR